MLQVGGMVIIGVLLLALVGLLLYQIRIDGYTRKEMFEIQIEMAKAQQAMTKELPWKELKTILDEIISFTVINYSLTNGLSKMKDEELTIQWVYILNDVSTLVETSMSDELKRQILKSISIDYLTSYIKNSVQLTIVYNLEKNKNNKVNNRLSNIREGNTKHQSSEKQKQEQGPHKK